MSINKERIKHVITRAIASISRVSRLTGAIMRTLSIIAESIDVTVMIVARTLVNIFEEKPPKWEKLVPLIIIFTKVQGRHTHTKKNKGYKKTQLYLQRFDLHYNIKPSVYFSRIYEETKNKNMLLPVQLLPSPEYPGLQVQLWDPSVLLHTALMSQLWVLIIHSSLSMKESAQRSQKYNIYL